MTERTTTIASRVGLHARPAAIFADAAGNFPFDVTISLQGAPDSEALDASSILSLRDWEQPAAPEWCSGPKDKAPMRHWIHW